MPETKEDILKRIKEYDAMASDAKKRGEYNVRMSYKQRTQQLWEQYRKTQ